MSLYMITTYLGSSLGQFLLNIPTTSGVTIYITVSVLFSIALVPISLTALPTPDISVYQSMSLKRLYKASPVGVIGCAVSGIFVGTFYILGPIYTAHNGLTVETTSLFMFLACWAECLPNFRSENSLTVWTEDLLCYGYAAPYS